MQISSAMAPNSLSSNPNNNNNNNSNNGESVNLQCSRSPATPLTSSLSLGLLSLPPSSSVQASHHPHHHHHQHHQHHQHHHHHHHQQQQQSVIEPEPIAAAHPSMDGVIPAAAAAPLSRVRLSDIVPFDGAQCGAYVRAVEALSGSLMRHNAAVIELGIEEVAFLRCALESAKLYFRSRAFTGVGGNVGGNLGKTNRGVHMYRAGRTLGDIESSPPCMADAFRCMGKAARTALCAIARHLRLRSDFFNHLLDDMPLPPNETSSSVLVATYSPTSLQNGKVAVGGGKPSINGEVEKGLLTLITSDSPGLQVCDPNNRWYLADGELGPGDVLLLTGKALSHATAGLRPAASYRTIPDYSSGIAGIGRTSLAFRLMPQGNAVLDCSRIATAGHVIPQSYVPITVSQFMDDLSAEDDVACTNSDTVHDARSSLNREPSLRSVLSDPLSAAAAAVKHEDDRRLFHNAALRKRRKEVGEQIYTGKRLSRENGEMSADGESPMHPRGVQYPFSVNEKVGNRRTPEKFVGREAVITSQCLNGCYTDPAFEEDKHALVHLVARAS
ncbi:hypothetical protein Scep_016000 [Stephania cephalantha]|uniref:PUB 62/63 C-terminal domain-containing protein n=1 Tax=Stephania cephalantha TaxID=152367 RepID=A0AAP0NS71_9MAGN